MREVGDPGRRVACGAVALVALFALGLPPAAHAARLVDVRVGLHPGHARVVLETDAPADWQVISAEAAEEVVVRLEAGSAARSVPARTPGTPSVEIEPTADGATLARIRASGPLRVETQVLTAPPRVVLDLSRSERTQLAPVPPQPPDAESGATSEVAPAMVESEAAPEPPAAALAGDDDVAAPVAAPAAPTPESVAAPPAVSPGVEPEPALPPVAAAPPAATIALDPRSLATGLALGFAVALFAFAARRPAPAAASPRAAEIESEPVAAEAPGALEATAALAAHVEPPVAAIEPDACAHDYARMHQRLDARLAAIAERLEAVAARQDHLDATGAAQGFEIASQRAAIARLRAALRPVPAPQHSPEREDAAPARRPR